MHCSVVVGGFMEPLYEVMNFGLYRCPDFRQWEFCCTSSDCSSRRFTMEPLNYKKLYKHNVFICFVFGSNSLPCISIISTSEKPHADIVGPKVCPDSLRKLGQRNNVLITQNVLVFQRGNLGFSLHPPNFHFWNEFSSNI